MKYSIVAAALAVPALAMPTKRQQNIDATVLQFALTLEHLENAFYKGALQTLSAHDFASAGFGANYYNNLKFIASDEQTHVTTISGALTAAGVTPVQPCTYKFPYTDVPSFLTLSSVLEGVGTSAYLGAAGLITSKDYLTVAGSILVSEALHTSLQRGAVNSIPFANPFGTPLSPNPVFTLAASFITGCPQGNAPLPFTAFPGLALKTAAGTCEQGDCTYGTSRFTNNNGKNFAPNAASQGASLTFTAAADVTAPLFLTFVSGLNVTSVMATASGRDLTANIPAGVSGQTYVLATRAAAAGKLDDAQVAFGPAIVEVTPAAV